MEVHISLEGRPKRTQEIYRQLRAMILDGRLDPGGRMPSSRELASRLDVARSTVVAAYEQLTGEGFLDTTRGSGTFVADISSYRNPERSPAANDSSPLRPRAHWESVPLPTAFDRPAQYDFRTGLADTTTFPFATWRRLMNEAGSAPVVRGGIYGHPAGLEQLRAAIATHIGVSRSVLVESTDIVVTNGTQQAIDLIARVMLQGGDRVAIEDPGYEPPRRLFESMGVSVARVPVDSNGIVVDSIPSDTKLVYVTPSHQYPLGVVMSLQRRLELLDWANEHDVAVIEDDYDSEFRFGGYPVEPLQTLDRTGRVIYVGSFSKTLLPILRIGFISAPPPLRHALAAAKYVIDWHTPLPTQHALANFIGDGLFAGHIRRLRRTYQVRHDQISVALSSGPLSKHLELIPANVGIHVAARLRGGTRSDLRQIVERAYDTGVAIQPFRSSFHRWAPGGFLFGYGAITDEHIAPGLANLLSCFE